MTEENFENLAKNNIGNKQKLPLAVIAIVIIVGMAVVGGIMFISRLLSGERNSIANIMPPETVVLLELNALNLADADASRVFEAFKDMLDENNIEFNVEEPTDMLEEIDNEIESIFDLTLEDDVLPWIGPNIGVGLLDGHTSMYRGGAPSLLLVATVRDTELADEFIEDFIESLEGRFYTELLQSTYNDVLLYEVNDDIQYTQLAFARFNNLFLIANDIDILEDAIDAQSGKNLQNTSAYKNTTSQLPHDRVLTLYINGEAFEDIAEESEMDTGFDADIIADAGIEGVGLSLSFIKAGIRMDAVTSFNSVPNDRQQLIDAQTNKIETADLLPESTYAFLVGHHLDLIWEHRILSLLEATFSEQEVRESMENFDKLFGFNPNTDLAPLLNGEFSLAIVEGGGGILGQEFFYTNLDLGLVMMVGSDDTESLKDISEDLADNLSDLGMSISDRERDNLAIYEVRETSRQTILSYGVSDDYLVVGTDRDDLESLFSDKNSLAESDKYKDVWRVFERGTIPLLYVDISGLFTILSELDSDIESTAEINPIYAVAAGMNFEKDISQTTLILFVKDN